MAAQLTDQAAERGLCTQDVEEESGAVQVKELISRELPLEEYGQGLQSLTKRPKRVLFILKLHSRNSR